MSTQDSSPSTTVDLVRITEVRVEYSREAFGIGNDRPRLSWMVETNINNWQQASYEIELYNADGSLREKTSVVQSGESVFLAWPFAPLASRQQIAIRVRVQGTTGPASDWSQPTKIEVALLQPQDWKAQFISPDWDEDTSKPQPTPMLRHEFDVKAGVKQARLYVTSLGVYEAELNGEVVGDHVMAPGWTSYSHRLRYQIFDVTQLLHEGRNAIGAWLGDGWFRGRLSFGGGRRNLYGNRLALLAQLEVTYADGTTETVATDNAWRAATGPILASDIYDGEIYDARLERNGWSKAGYADSDWKGMRLVERDFASLEAPVSPPVRCIGEMAPVAILTTPSGRTVLDFGQNVVGRLRLTVNGPAGHTITLRFAEVLENGEIATRPLRTAKATDTYTLRGNGPETWRPRFTFHGFRYAEINDWPGQLTVNDVCVEVCHSDMTRTGWFECSHPLINRLHENVLWSMRGNFFYIPTDCPQRDERLGWTGDIQIFAPTASFLYDTTGFLASWMKDVAVEQKDANGVVPVVVPNTMPGPALGAAAWSDAAAIVPWVQYQRFADREILVAQFESMRSFVDKISELAGERRLWDTGFQFGDWLDPAAPAERPEEALTNRHLIASAYFAHSARLVSQIASILGRSEEEAYYRKLSEEVREAFAREYVTPSGRLLSDAQTAYAVGLEFDLIPTAEQRQRAAERLLDLVRANGFRIGTGFVGTPLMCDALCNIGNYAAAYRLILQQECPSWLYPVTMGATTVWERWDSLLPNGQVNPGEMTSFNHYALGAVADWLHRVVGGLAPAVPGYRKIAFQPRPGGGLTQASARHITPYGPAECSWSIHDGQIDVTVVVPPNTSATVVLPGKSTEALEVGSGTYKWSYAYADPDNKHAFSLDSTIGEITDDPQAWGVVVDTLNRLAPASSFTANRLQSQSTTTLRQGIVMMANADKLLAEVETALVTFAKDRAS